MTLIIVLFVAGVLLLAAEVVVPGAILGVIGGIAMLIGVIVAFDRYGFNGGALATGIAFALVALALFIEFVLLPKSRLARKLSMTATVAGTSQPPIADRGIVGKRAVAVTTLAPSGIVECEGRRFEAFARTGHVAAGEQLDIIGIDNFRLIVSKTSTHPNS